MAARKGLRAVTDAPRRAVIYLRQSTSRDDSISLELQEIACRDYCDRMGYTVIEVCADPGISGRTWSKRPDVQRAMAAVEDGSADVIVLWKWSRLSRSRKDWALAADRVDIAGGRIESATEPIDTATASGRFARGVMTEYAAFQSEQIGETWEEVRQRRLSLGLPASGRLPYGWRWIKKVGMERHPDQAPVVVEMYRRYLGGDGSSAIARWLNATGVPGPNGAPWTRARPLTVLDSPIHVGLIPYRGATYQGAHEAIIDEGTWKAYNSERARRREVGTKPRQSEHLLSMMMRCECAAKMHGKGSITGGKWYGGYICGNRLNVHPQRAYVSALTIEPVIVDWFMTFEITVPSGHDDIVERAKHDQLLRRANDLEQQLVDAARGSLRNELPAPAYQRLIAELNAEYLDVTARAATSESRHSATAHPTEIATARKVWPASTTAEKNNALRRVIDRIHLRGDDTAEIITQWGTSSVVTF